MMELLFKVHERACSFFFKALRKVKDLFEIFTGRSRGRLCEFYAGRYRQEKEGSDTLFFVVVTSLIVTLSSFVYLYEVGRVAVFPQHGSTCLLMRVSITEIIEINIFSSNKATYFFLQYKYVAAWDYDRVSKFEID